MQILSDFKQYQSDGRPLILALGNFDGVHLGHQELLSRVTRSAKASGGTPAVLTFREHPQHILHPSSKPPLLTSLEHRLFLLAESGIELCFLMSFTPEFSRLDPSVFVRDILAGRLGAREIYLGHNARFGKNREGNADLMRSLSRECGFQFHQLEPVQAFGDTVSSSRIRTLVREGRLDEVELCLGRKFSVFGKVVKGAGRGSKIGFPTANLDVESEILPPLGVYPVEVRELELENPAGEAGAPFKVQKAGPWQAGILNYGYRPTFDEAEKKAVPEVYLLDFKGDLYEKTLEIRFRPKLRSEMTFSSVDALKNQIQSDILRARQVLGLKQAVPAEG